VTSKDSAPGTAAWLTPGPLRIDLGQPSPQVAVIYVRGELDRATAPTLAPCLNHLLDPETPYRTLIIDLTATTFVDAGGLNLLLSTHRRATAAGIAFHLAGCSRQVRRILQITQTEGLPHLLPSQRTAEPAGTNSTAHTDVPSSNSVTPHRVDRAVASVTSPEPSRT
jgi:anti-sigma B factor antagonist